MDKKELKLLKIEQLPNTIETSQISDSMKIRYAFVAKKHSLGKEQILEVIFFSLYTKIAEFRVFFNKNLFITEKLNPERCWSESTIENLICAWNTGIVCANEHSKELICKYFKTEENPYKAMREFQAKLRKTQLAQRHKKETDKIDAHMKLMPSLPKYFERWVNEVALNKSRYIYYKKVTSNKMEGFCTSCLSNVTYHISKNNQFKDVRHNQPGKCPLCGNRVIYKAVGKTTLLVDYVNAAIIQKTKKGLVVRYFAVTKEYKGHYKNPTLHIHEQVRDFYEDGQCITYEYNNYKQTGRLRWCYSANRFNPYNACLYTRNLRRVLNDTEWKYSCIYELAKNMDNFNVDMYLRAYKNYPVYEYLIRLRLFKLVAENTTGYRYNSEINLNGNGINEVLGIDKLMLKQLQRINGSIEHLALLKLAYKATIYLKDDEINWVVKNGVNADNFVKLLKYTTAHKVIKYVENCCVTMKKQLKADDGFFAYGSPQANIVNDWRDYLENSALLGYDLKNSMLLFPMDLKSRHDEVVVRINAESNELFNKAIIEMSEKLNSRFGYKGKSLIIYAPRSADEIIAEGHALHHCVGGRLYIEGMAKGEHIILFIRRVTQPDEPFYTIEIKDNIVNQCRGKNNHGMTDEVKQFISEWQKKKLKVNKTDKSA